MRLVLFLLATLSSFPLQAKPKWEPVSTEDGIEVYAMEVAGSDLIAFKGIKTMNQPIGKMAFVLLNLEVEAKKQWVDRMMEFQVLELTDDHSVTYSSYNLPWPMNDRDFVIRSDFVLDKKEKTFTLFLKSVEHEKAPETVGVRGVVYKSRYALKALSKDQTKVEVEIHSDPKGLLPKWLINRIQRRWPYNTLSKMELQAAKPHVKSHKKVAPLL